MPLEVIVGAAVGAAATSQRIRKVVRRGVVYGLAGALVAYDKITAVAHGVVKGARDAAAPTPVQPENVSAAAPADKEHT